MFARSKNESLYKSWILKKMLIYIWYDSSVCDQRSIVEKKELFWCASLYVWEACILHFSVCDKLYVKISFILHVCCVKKTYSHMYVYYQKKILTKSKQKSIFSYRKRWRHSNILVWPFGVTFLFDSSENMLEIRNGNSGS